MSRAHQRRNKRVRQPTDKQADDLERLLLEGHDVVQLSEHHYRVDRYIDFWPITGRWRQMNGAFEGVGLPALIEKMRSYV